MKKIVNGILSFVIFVIPIITILFMLFLPRLVNGNFDFLKQYIDLYGYPNILSYGATVLSVISTVILSCITVAISRKANEVSDRMLKLEEERMTPYLDILREKSDIVDCKDDDSKLKVKLYIRNIGEYPIQNILLSRKELSKKEIKRLYAKDEIQDTIIEQFEKNDSDKKDTFDYNLTCIAGLREMIIIHSKRKNGEKAEEEEHTPFSEWLYFNIDKKEVGTPIDLFITMQNIAGKVFLQRTKLFIVQRNQDKKYFLTMHSKRIETIEL